MVSHAIIKSLKSMKSLVKLSEIDLILNRLNQWALSLSEVSLFPSPPLPLYVPNPRNFNRSIKCVDSPLEICVRNAFSKPRVISVLRHSSGPTYISIRHIYAPFFITISSGPMASKLVRHVGSNVIDRLTLNRSQQSEISTQNYLLMIWTHIYWNTNQDLYVGMSIFKYLGLLLNFDVLVLQTIGSHTK